MSKFQTNRELIFMGGELSRPRMTVEREKVDLHFSGFNFYGSGGAITSVQGYLSTSYNNLYYVKIEIPSGYPYVLPKIFLPRETIDSSCPHRYADGSLCVMRSDQWTSTFSLAFMIAKAAIWINKYDSWKRNGKRRWPGKGQTH
jgi:hypothetical protein